MIRRMIWRDHPGRQPPSCAGDIFRKPGRIFSKGNSAFPLGVRDVLLSRFRRYPVQRVLLRKANTNVELREEDMRTAQAAHVAAREQQAKMQATYDWLHERLRDLPEEVAATPAAAPTPTPVTKPAPAPTGTLVGKPLPEVTHAELSHRALKHLGKSVTTKQVREQIREFGHELDQQQVRSSLKYL